MKKKEIYLVPYAHLDTQWRWEYPTTIEKYLKATLEKNFFLFEKYPGHRFNFTGALRYAMIRDYYPDEYKLMLERIKEGRWHIAGTCLDETDALLPSIESQVRNILYGQRWAKREMAIQSRDYMIPDCFGFPANMPTVMSHCSISGFSTQKLTWNSAVGIPFELGMWKGPDGSEIASALNPCRYLSPLPVPVHHSPSRLRRLKALGESTGVWKSFQYYGVGDIGGAPAEGAVRRALKSIDRTTRGITVTQGAADRFFDELTDDEKAAMERYQGDLLLVNHSAGILTSAAIMKRWNRRNEQMAFAAEAAAVTARWTAGIPYPGETVESAWHRVVGSQMHDILPGTSTPNAYEFAQNDEVVALSMWTGVLNDSVSAVAAALAGEGTILLYNPCPEPRTDAVDLVVGDGYPSETSLVAVDAMENEYPCQTRETAEGEFVATFVPPLPSVGWKRFTLRETIPSTEPGVSLTESGGNHILENEHCRVRIGAGGGVESLYSKVLGREILKRPLGYEFQREKPMIFPAWNMDWRDRKKPPSVRIEGGETRVLERGPVRCTIRIETPMESSRFVREISLAAGSPTIDFTERIDWRGAGFSVKLAVASDMKHPRFTTNWETSRVDRGVNHETCFEMPSRLWVDLTDGGEWGFSILEDSKYGYDRPSDDVVRMTLLYTPATRLLNGFKDQKSQDWGEHTIRWALYPHRGDWRGTDAMARRFNQPIRPYRLKPDTPSGSLDELSMLRISTEQLGVSALKTSEDSDDMVIRVYERHGRHARGRLEFPEEILEAFSVDGQEEELGPATHDGAGLEVELPANGMAAYRVRLAVHDPPSSSKETPLQLPMNAKLFDDGDNTGIFPGESIPDALSIRGISFYPVRNGALDTLSCRGQAIALPPEDRRLHLLCAADRKTAGKVEWLDDDGAVIGTGDLVVPALQGFLGQWDTRRWKKEPRHFRKQRRDYFWLNTCTGVTPGWVERGRLAWHTNRTRKNGRNLPYRYGYMFACAIDIPEGASVFRLPDREEIKIFAATSATREETAVSAYPLKDKYDF